MELNWGTFLIEIVNFLILIWILKRFLYQPVLAAVARRKAAIDKTLADAKSTEDRAQALSLQYRNRLAEWEGEKEKLRVAVDEEMDARRAKMMADLQEAVAREREKARAVEEHRAAEVRDKAEKEGIDAGVQFTARLLTRLASAGLEAALADLAIEDMRQVTAEKLPGVDGHPVTVTSAFPLPEARRAALEREMGSIAGGAVNMQFTEDSRLLAGLRVSAGPWVLRANLEDELQFFAEAVHDGSRN